MAAKYVDVTELEFDSVLKSDKGWKKEQKGNEWVYSYVSKKNPDITIYVYSSVTPRGISKTVGKDAIRICAVNTKTNRGIIKSKRVNRVPGWEERTKQKVIETLEYIK